VVTGAVVLLASGAIVRSRRVGLVETDVFRLVNDLPKSVYGPMVGVMQAGALAAVPVAAGAALVARRPRLARDLGAAGAAAWLVAKLAKDVVGRGRPGSLLEGVVMRGGTAAVGLGFPSEHVAVAAAMATAAGPHLGRHGRRAAWGVVGLVGVGRMYVGAHLPVDIVGGLVLGWIIGALLHLLWGAPGGIPTLATVQAALTAAGLAPVTVTRARVDARGSTPFFVRTAARGDLFVKAVGKTQRDANVLFKGWRYLALRHVEDESPFATPKQQVEHEAYLALLAERAGARVPAVVTATMAPDGTALLVQARLQGKGLDAVDPEAMDDGLLLGVWAEVAKLRAARIAHRDLRLANLLDVDGEPWIIDFGFAEAAASDRRLAQDVAELLASLSSRVGAVRAVSSARQSLGPEALAAALPLLQPLALSTRLAVTSTPRPACSPSCAPRLPARPASSCRGRRRWPGSGPARSWPSSAAASPSICSCPRSGRCARPSTPSIPSAGAGWSLAWSSRAPPTWPPPWPSSAPWTARWPSAARRPCSLPARSATG